MIMSSEGYEDFKYQAGVTILNPEITVEVNNFPSEYPIPSSQISDLQQITITGIAAGIVIPVNIENPDINVNVQNFPSEFPLPTDQIDSLKNITIENIAAGIVIPVNIENTSITVNVENFPSEYPLPSSQVSDLQQITIQNIVAGLVIPISIEEANATVNIQGDVNSTIAGIVAGVVIPISIDSVKDGVVFDIHIASVESGVTFNVNITNTSLTVVIDTSGGPVDINIKSSEATITITPESTAVFVIEPKAGVVFNIQGSVDANITNSSIDVNVLGGELEVNVGTFPFEKASENILENPDFEDGTTSGWFTQGGVTISASTEKAKSGSYSMKIVSDGTQGNVLTSEWIYVQPKQKIRFSVWVYREANVDVLKIGLWQSAYGGGWVGLQTKDISDIPADSWQPFDAIFEIQDGVGQVRVGFVVKNTDGSSAVYVDSLYVPRMVLVGHSTEIPVNINIAGQEQDIEVKITGQSQDINVNITGQSQDINVKFVGQTETLNINIESVSSGVTFNVNVTNATLNVEVQGTASVSIDNATVYLNIKQESFTETRRTLENHGDTASYTDTVLCRGKFFPHGARGYISKIYVRCKNTDTADHQFTVYVSVAPKEAPLITKTVTVTADFDDWLEIEINRFWNYDGIFIAVLNDDASLQVAYDVGTPYDAWGGSTDYYQLIPANLRYWIKVNVHGQTTGDIPVSGTVNTINIPNIGTGYDVGDTEIPGYSEYELVSIQGMGKLLWATVYSNYAYALVRIYADGSKAFEYAFSGLHSHGFENANFGVQLIQYDTSTNKYRMIIGIPIPFKRELKIAVYNGQSTSIYASAKVIAEVIS